MGGQLLTQIPFTRIEANTSGTAIDLTLNSRAVLFTSSDVIAAPATVAIGGGLNNYSLLRWRFEVSGLPAITFPVNIKSSDPTFTNNVWQPLNDGEYELVMSYNGTEWVVESLIGPYA